MKNRTLRLTPWDTCSRSYYAQHGTECLGLIIHRAGQVYSTDQGNRTGTLPELVRHYENKAYFNQAS